MKHKVFLTAILMIAMSITTNAVAQNYDFSAVASTGQTLYYRITDSSSHTVAVTHPATGTSTSAWNGYTTPTGSLEIPATVSYHGISYIVATIDRYAFSYCSGLTSVTIGGSVTSIGQYAFYNCSGLTSVTIGGSVTTIGGSAFDNCSGLTSVTIGNSVTSIGYYAFQNCSGLASVTIPNSVTSIGDNAFYNCSGLTSVTFNADSCISAGRNVRPIFDGCSNLTSITFGNNVKRIPHYLCYGCSGLTSVTIPNHVTSIGDNAFYNCSGLESIVVESSNLYYDSRNNCNAIIETATNTLILGCKNTTIPNSVTSIGLYAFYGCIGLTGTLSIPNSVISIGNGAFIGCTGLTSLIIPNSVTSISNSAFSGCTGLTSLIIPNSVTSIGSYAFHGCTGLTSVTIGNSVTSIDDDTFFGCTGLTSVTIPNSVTHIGNCAFQNCTGLTSVTIPNSVTFIGIYAFKSCTGLTSVTIPNSVTSIGNSAFQNCSGLTSVVFNADSCIYAGGAGGYYAIFNGCSNLTNITFGNNVKQIPADLCSDLTVLTSVTIGNSVTTIGNGAFYGCRGLRSITCYADLPPAIVVGNSFLFVPQTIPVYVPCGSLAAYRSANYWRNFSNTQENPECAGVSSVTACDSYTWRGTTYTTSGTYAYRQNASQVDTLYLTVNYNSNASQTMTACDSYIWNNHGNVRVYTERGVYYNSYATADGCPSVDTLYLTLNNSNHTGTTITACDGFYWSKTDSAYRATGIYVHLDSNAATTCVNSDTLYLTINASTHVSETQLACESHVWHNATYSATGDYMYPYLNGANCESVDTLHLTIQQRIDSVLDTEVCGAMLWSQTGLAYTTSGIYRDSAYVELCWNYYTMNLTVNHSSNASETIAANDWYVWYNHGNANVYTTSGTYFSSYTTPEGCPSVDTLYLTVNVTPPVHDSVYITVDCPPQDTLYVTETVAVHDTTIVNNYIHDTTIVDNYVHDTTFIDNYIHDTTYLPIHTSDTVYLGSPDADTVWLTRTEWEYIHDTIYQTVNHYIHDTVVLDNYIHDTTVVNNYIHDTVLVQGSGSDTVWMGGTHTVCIHDTLYRNVYFHVRDTVIIDHYHDTLVLERTIVDYVHDTAYINLYIHDTTVVTDYVHDTTIIDNYIYDTLTVTNHVHDTAYITTMVYDTLYVDTNTHDTVWLTRTVHEYIHDTVYRTVNHYIHDTTFVTNYVHDTAYINRYIHDTTFVHNYIHDTLYLYRYLHDTIYIHDTVYIHGEGISAADVVNAKVYSSRGQVVVEGADGNPVTLYDLAGRALATRRDGQPTLRFDVPASGTYLIKIGRHAPRKVVVIK